tara:strand:+ start:1255 stop:1665 length:411 start_codon:yes stop_codon:yes gene_type:complete
MAYKQETNTPLAHCWANVMHIKPWNKMRSRTAAAAGRGTGNNPSLAKAEEKRTSPFEKQKGGGTRKVCLPAAKVRSMSSAEKKKVVAAKESAASQGKYKRSSKSNVKGARKKGATLRDWFEKENWINVKTGEPCGK